MHRWLSTDAYWAVGRSREMVERSFANSRVYGVYRGDGGQVGVARVVTDEATFAWLCDVYVDRAVRGQGIARWLVAAIRDDLEAVGVRRIVLGTRDAHGVYEKVGFASLRPAGPVDGVRPAPSALTCWPLACRAARQSGPPAASAGRSASYPQAVDCGLPLSIDLDSFSASGTHGVPVVTGR